MLNGKNLTATGTFSNTGGIQLFGSETVTITANDTDSGGWEYVGDNDGVAENFTIKDFGASDYYLLYINDSSATNDTFRLGANLRVINDFSLVDGAFQGLTYTINLTGASLYIYDGTFTSTSGTLTTQSFSNSGTFVHNNGTVVIDTTSTQSGFISLSSLTTFYKLTAQETTNDSLSSTLSVNADFIVANQLTLDGLDANDMLNIRSSTNGIQRLITMTGSSTLGAARDFLDIKDNGLVDSSTGVTVPVNPTSSVNSGNTTNWFTAAISGTVYTDEGVTTMGAGRTVRLLKNGTDTGLTGTTNASGNYSIANATIISGDIATLYIDGATENGVTVSILADNDTQNLDIYQDFLIIRSETGAAITNANLDTANNGDGDIIAIYIDGTGTTFGSANNLSVRAGSTYTPGGSIVVGYIHIESTAVFNGGANTISVNFGNFDNDGTLNHTGILSLYTNTLAGSITFNPGSAAIGSQLIITGNTGGVINLVDNNLNIGANPLSIDFGMIFALNGKNVTFSGAFSNEGTLRLYGSEAVTTNGVTLITNDINSGIWEYVGNGDSAATSYTIKDFGATDYYNLVINDTSTNFDSFNVTSTLNIAGNLTVTDGRYLGGSVATDVRGNVTIGSAGNMTATTSAGFTIGGDFTNSGIFTTSGGSVTFDANVNHTITGSNTWSDLIFTETLNNATDSTITFASGSTQTITGSFAADGLDTNDRLNIVSSVPGTVATIAFTGSSSFFAAHDFLDVKDSTLTDTSSGVTLPINPASSLDSGNTVGWFSTMTGVLRPSEGTTNTSMNGKTIRLLVNGVDSGMTATTSNNAASGGLDGEFSVSKPVSVVSGDILTFYVDGDATVDAVTVTKTDASTLTGFELIQDTLIIRHENGTSITSANLNTANNGDTDITAIFADAATLTTVSGKDLLINTGDTYAPASTVTVGGDFHVMTGATYSGAATAVTVGGNLDNDGTWTQTAGASITFNGTVAQTFNPGSAAISNTDISITNTAGEVSLVDNHLNIGANTLTIATNAIFSLAGKNLTMSSTFSNNGTFRLQGGETITSLTQDTNSGTWEYTGDGDSAADAYTIKDFGTTDYFNLVIASTDSADTFSSSAAKAVAGTMTVSGGTYNANASATTVTNTLIIENTGIMLSSTAVQTYGAISMPSGTPTFLAQSGNIDVNGDVTLSAGTFTSPTSSITILGNFTNAIGTNAFMQYQVFFDPSVNHTITGSTTWHTLTFSEASNTTADSTITFEAGSTQTITGTLSVDGLDANDMLNIVSSTPGTAVTINLTGTGAFSATHDFIDVTDNYITDNSTGFTPPVLPTSSINGGNTSNWFSANLSGILRPSEGATSAGMNGKTVRLLKNGVDTGLTGVTANNAAGGGFDGEFSMTSPVGVVSGDILTLFVDGDATVDAVTVTSTDALSYSNFELVQDTLLVQNESGTSVTAANLNTANNGDTDITAIYADAATLTTASGKDLLINTSDTFAPGSAVVVGGDMHVSTSAVYSGSTFAISVAGNLDNDGTWTHTGTLTFNGTSAQTFNPGSATIGSDISVTNTTGAVTLADNNLNIGVNTLTIATNAIFALGGKNFTIASTFSNNGTFRLYGSETITFTSPAAQDKDSGTWEYVGDGDGLTDTYNLKYYGITPLFYSYYNLRIASTDSGDIFSGAVSSIYEAGTLTVTNGTFDASGNSHKAEGAGLISGGTYDTNGSATQILRWTHTKRWYL